MYDWQMRDSCTRPILEGQTVELNPEWSGYNYLQREFGSKFPAGVQERRDSGDIIVVRSIPFARQVLRAVR